MKLPTGFVVTSSGFGWMSVFEWGVMTHVWDAGVGSTLPHTSIAAAVNVWLPAGWLSMLLKREQPWERCRCGCRRTTTAARSRPDGRSRRRSRNRHRPTEHSKIAAAVLHTDCGSGSAGCHRRVLLRRVFELVFDRLFTCLLTALSFLKRSWTWSLVIA